MNDIGILQKAETPAAKAWIDRRESTRRGVPIRIAGLSKAYGHISALQDIGLDIPEGEFLTLLGPSGSGKSTLLMALAGFVRPTRGSIIFGGRDVTYLPPHRRGVGVMFQNYALFPNMNVAGNIAYPLRIRKRPRTEIEQRVREAVRMVRLEQFLDRRVDSLSGGQRQRVALARAIVFEPEVLLMDEPLSALDKNLRDHMQIEIRRLHQQLRITTVYVTHDQREALTLSDRIAVMNHGKIAQLATPRDLYEKPTSRFVAQFVGDATLLELKGTEGHWQYGGRPLKAGYETFRRSHDHFVVLRPEKLRIHGGNEASDPAVNYFDAVFGEAVYQGEGILATLQLSQGDEVRVRLPSNRRTIEVLPQPGEAVLLALHAMDTLVVPGTEA
jgi:putative spermidine/putrescine transport system ATP-binding protein